MRKIKRKLLRVIVEAIANVHWHGREIGALMRALIREAIRGGADVLGFQPNTNEPLTRAAAVINYLRSAEHLIPQGEKMRFLPFIMLTEETTREELVLCVKAGIYDGKIYPYMRTTKSKHGVRRYGKILQVVKWCGELGIKVHVHFEHPDPVYINRDAEYLCLPIAQIFLEETDAILIWEHGSDSRCISAWKKFAKTGRFYVTLTAHHLAWDEDKAFGDVRRKCKPPIKTERDRISLVQFVSEGHSFVMLGADDAAHDIHAKHVHEGKCACGAFTSPFLLALCAHALSHLLRTKKGLRIFIDFTSRNARKLHKLPPATRKIALIETPFKIPKSYKIGPWTVEPPGAGEEIGFQIDA
ncbi:MAG: dihydroorotase [Parcubacteria group bacterium Gr01-1014_72]|nr:MAG: dihydroorotase [Parcubacteria group bacterium Gr01-1014_72]